MNNDNKALLKVIPNHPALSLQAPACAKWCEGRAGAAQTWRTSEAFNPEELIS